MRLKCQARFPGDIVEKNLAAAEVFSTCTQKDCRFVRGGLTPDIAVLVKRGDLDWHRRVNEEGGREGCEVSLSM